MTDYTKEIEYVLGLYEPMLSGEYAWHTGPGSLAQEEVKAIKAMYEENKKLKRRLEIDTCFNSKGEVIPVENPETFPDKIECLETEIKHYYEPKIEELREHIAKLRKTLAHMTERVVDLPVHVTSEDAAVQKELDELRDIIRGKNLKIEELEERISTASEYF